MADGDFEHTGHLAHKGGEVVAVQVVPGIHAQAGIQRSLGCFGIAGQLLGLLRDLGLLPTLDAETATLANLRPEGRYTLVAEGGLRTASQADRASLAGSQWRALQEALDEAASYTATLRACAPVAAELKPQLRAVLQYHCGSPVLRTRQLMMDLQSL